MHQSNAIVLFTQLYTVHHRRILELMAINNPGATISLPRVAYMTYRRSVSGWRLAVSRVMQGRSHDLLSGCEQLN